MHELYGQSAKFFYAELMVHTQ